jgi:hypothetical protein
LLIPAWREFQQGSLGSGEPDIYQAIVSMALDTCKYSSR